MALVLTVVFATIGAMLVLSLVTVGGRWLVRGLRLPTDLPDGCRYEPPPPPAAPRAGAEERARMRGEWRAIYDDLATAVAAWRRASELLPGDDAGLQAAREACEAAEAALEKQAPDQAAAREAAAGARNACEEALTRARATLDPAAMRAERRRLIGLLVVLVILVAWMLVIMPLLRGGGGAGP